jgi:dolichol-phosphate mannosyltransferase
MFLKWMLIFHTIRNILKSFIEKITEGYDLVIGSRYINGISVLNWPLRRLILSYMASVYTRMVTGLKVMDTLQVSCATG